MSKIEDAMLNAVETRRNWQSGNTSVRYEGGKSYVRLHGYLIAIYNHAKRTWRYSDARVEHEGEECGTKLPFVNDFCEGDGGKIHYNRKKGTYEVWSN